MAIVNNGLIGASGSAEADLEAGIGRTFSRTYQLTSDNIVTDDENAVLNAVGINLYSGHPSYAYAWVNSIKVDLQEVIFRGPAGPNGAIWHATVDYAWIAEELRDGDGNPLDAPITWSTTYEAEEQPLFVDVNDVPVLNAAGDYFDPPITTSRQRGILNVFVNVGSIDAVALDSWGNRINAGIWNTFPAQTVRLLPIEIPQREYDEATDTAYWPLVFRFQIRNPETWKRKILNQGYRELHTSGATTTQRNILVDGVPATSPVLLDDVGHPLPIPVDPDDIVYLEFDEFADLDFSVLGLDAIPNFPSS